MAANTKQIASQVIKEILGAAPRTLVEVEAELLFLKGGQLLLHLPGAKGDEAHSFKFISGKQVLAAFGGQLPDSGWLPEGIVRVGASARGTFVVKWLPPGRHAFKVWIKDGDQAESLLAVTMPMPGLVMIGMSRSYYLFAVKGDKLEMDSVVYYPPLPNIMMDMSVCYGPENLPPDCMPGTMGVAWQIFLDAPFNSHMMQARSRKFPQDVRELMQELNNSPAAFPYDDLVYMRAKQLGLSYDETVGLKVESLVNHLIRKSKVN